MLFLDSYALVYSEFYNNGEDGLVAFQLEDNSKIMIEDVTAKNNAYGIGLTGTGITVKNANMRNNNLYGLEIGDNVSTKSLLLEILLSQTTEMQDSSLKTLVFKV